jgi:hypothetical protein
MATIEIFPADDIFPAFLAGIKPCDIIMHKVYCVKLIIYSQESYRFNRSSKIYMQVWQQKVRYTRTKTPLPPSPQSPIPPLPPPTILQRQNNDVLGQAGMRQG